MSKVPTTANAPLTMPSDRPTLADEYKEAGNLFRSGFTTIGGIITSFSAINGILLTSAGVIIGRGAHNMNTLLVVVCILGIIGTVVTSVIHVRMTIYIRSWLNRAAEIERASGLYIYLRTYEIEISSRKNPIQTYTLMRITYAVVGLFWLCLALYAYFIPLDNVLVQTMQPLSVQSEATALPSDSLNKAGKPDQPARLPEE